jgi:hypothetical protein
LVVNFAKTEEGLRNTDKLYEVQIPLITDAFKKEIEVVFLTNAKKMVSLFGNEKPVIELLVGELEGLTESLAKSKMLALEKG